MYVCHSAVSGQIKAVSTEDTIADHMLLCGYVSQFIFFAWFQVVT
jgi:hypothetical protein